MLTRRQLLQGGTSLALGASLVQEEFLQAAQAEANPVKITGTVPANSQEEHLFLRLEVIKYGWKPQKHQKNGIQLAKPIHASHPVYELKAPIIINTPIKNKG